MFLIINDYLLVSATSLFSGSSSNQTPTTPHLVPVVDDAQVIAVPPAQEPQVIADSSAPDEDPTVIADLSTSAKDPAVIADSSTPAEDPTVIGDSTEPNADPVVIVDSSEPAIDARFQTNRLFRTS